MGKILIVDDEPQVRQSFEKILTQDGHVVKTAASGEAALAAVKADIPDLVIMDVRLPAFSWNMIRFATARRPERSPREGVRP